MRATAFPFGPGGSGPRRHWHEHCSRAQEDYICMQSMNVSAKRKKVKLSMIFNVVRASASNHQMCWAQCTVRSAGTPARTLAHWHWPHDDIKSKYDLAYPQGSVRLASALSDFGKKAGTQNAVVFCSYGVVHTSVCKVTTDRVTCARADPLD